MTILFQSLYTGLIYGHLAILILRFKNILIFNGFLKFELPDFAVAQKLFEILKYVKIQKFYDRYKCINFILDSIVMRNNLNV